MVDALPAPRPLQRRICLPLPRLAGVLQPRLRHGRPRFLCAALLRGLRVVALEPLLLAALDPVIGPLREHQVRVGILPVRATSMDGKRVGQPLPFGHARREAGSQFPPLFLIQFLGKRKLNFAVQRPLARSCSSAASQ